MKRWSPQTPKAAPPPGQSTGAKVTPRRPPAAQRRASVRPSSGTASKGEASQTGSAIPPFPNGLEVLLFRAEVAQWVARLHVTPRQVRVQAMTHKWACCSRAGTVTFSLGLLQQPAAFRDYAIVYELLQLRAAKDSPLFQTLLQLYVPDYQAIRAVPLPSQPGGSGRTL